MQHFMQSVAWKVLAFALSGAEAFLLRDADIVCKCRNEDGYVKFDNPAGGLLYHRR